MVYVGEKHTGLFGQNETRQKNPHIRFFWTSDEVLTKYRFKRLLVYSVSESTNSCTHSFAFCMLSLKLVADGENHSC